LLRSFARSSPQLVSRFLRDGDARIAPELVDALVRRTYATNVRELEAILWRAMLASPGDVIALPDDLRAPTAPSEPSSDQIRAALARADGSVRRAAHTLGLTSRYALYRLMKKHGLPIEVAEDDA
jgi:two-component system nitrogen regulation response regulator GlnG/two-component system response regulator HydG